VTTDAAQSGAATQTPPIPVNLVIGFLGVGKTTAVRHLLARHPGHERWAVLVNEFGEIGVDGALLADTGVTVEEVAGGCLCCVSAPAFTTGLNRLIRQHRPERILIEPSGLGHPAKVLETLTGPLYRGLLEVRATICLVDARHLRSPRHLAHETFQDQIHLADVLVANKADCYGPSDLVAFEDFTSTLTPRKLKLGLAEHGVIDPAWLDLKRDTARHASFPEAHAFLVDTQQVAPDSSGDEDWVVIEGSDNGYKRAGWLIRQHNSWPENLSRELVSRLATERKKGVLLTERGWLSFNQDTWNTTAAPADGFSRLELIDADSIDTTSIDHDLRQLLDAVDKTASG
jgi:G3E family GTPase